MYIGLLSEKLCRGSLGSSSYWDIVGLCFLVCGVFVKVEANPDTAQCSV
jgi:hypothetical protein